MTGNDSDRSGWGSTGRILASAVLLVLFSGARHLLAEPPFAYVGLVIENDSVARTDQYYTHGLRLDFRFPRATTASLMEGIFRRFPSRGQRVGTVGLFLGQYLFTPEAIEAEEPPLADRPYGGWLHLGVQADVPAGPTVLDRVSLSLGVMGPSSGSKRVQTLIHRLIGSPEPLGWDTQIPDDLAVDLRFERRWNPFPAGRKRWGWEWIPYAGGHLGSVLTLAHAGCVVRVGSFFPDDFAASFSGPSGYPGSGTARTTSSLRGNLFVAAEARYVLYNALLDGSLFQESRSVAKNAWVHDWTVGLQGTLWHDFMVTGAYVFRSEEFKNQPRGHRFGVLSIGYWF